jgi:hypothetical protein
MPTIKVPKQENQTLKSSDDIVNAINNADPRTNTYMPLSAGVESTAALIYTQRDPDMHPFCVYWYDQRYGMFSDAMAFYTQKQAEFYNLPYGNDKSMLSVLPHTREVPIIVSGLSSFMSVVLGAPGWRRGEHRRQPGGVGGRHHFACRGPLRAAGAARGPAQARGRGGGERAARCAAA